MEPPQQIYMDVCCLNRPFDDWSQPRIRIEAEAVLEILSKCQLQEYSLISSTALELEINQTPDPIRKSQVQASLSIAKSRVIVIPSIMTRAQELVQLGFKPFDSLHIACAESAQAHVFLTTDDRLRRKAQANLSLLTVTVSNPVNWFIEISDFAGEA